MIQEASSNLGFRPCLLCGKNEKDIRYEAKLPETSENEQAMHYQYHQKGASNTWHYRIVACKSCGHRFADPIYDAKTVESSYLFQNHDNEFELDPDLLKKTNEGYASIAKRYLVSSEQRRCQLDIGCDTGNFIKATRSFGFKRVIGIEPGVDSARRAGQIPGVEIMQKVFDPSDFQAGSLDFVSLIHVLDHLVDSRKVIHDLKSRLAKRATVIAVVHNIASPISKISGEAWAPLNLVHMEYFTPKTLGRLFEVEGYKVLTVEGTRNFFPLSHLIRFAPFIPPGIRSAMVKAGQAPLLKSVVLGLRLGNIAVVATPA